MDQIVIIYCIDCQNVEKHEPLLLNYSNKSE